MMNNPNVINMLMSFIQSGNNPQQYIQGVIKQNPQLNAVFNQMKQSGLSAKDFTIQFAKQNNINLEPFIQALKDRGIKM